jgi:hypothetical protein
MLLARRSIALLAAYVVALQMLLLPLGVAAASVVSGVHCTADQPAQHQTQGCPCAAGCGTGCCVQALASPPPTPSALVLALTAPAPLQIAAYKAVRAALPVAHPARAPPAAERI